jgi:hypothetical protein
MSWSKAYESRAEFTDTARRNADKNSLPADQQRQYDTAVAGAEALLPGLGDANADVRIAISGHANGMEAAPNDQISVFVSRK